MNRKGHVHLALSGEHPAVLSLDSVDSLDATKAQLAAGHITDGFDGCRYLSPRNITRVLPPSDKRLPIVAAAFLYFAYGSPASKSAVPLDLEAKLLLLESLSVLI